MKPVAKYYWDAVAFLALFNEEEGRADQCIQVLTAAEKGEVQIVTSSFTLVEVLHIKGREKMNPEKEERITAFFENDYILLVDVNRSLAESARQLIWRNSGLKPKDAIHVATAVSVEADELQTYDDYLLKLNGKIGAPPMRIATPSLKQPELAFGAAKEEKEESQSS